MKKFLVLPLILAGLIQPVQATEPYYALTPLQGKVTNDARVMQVLDARYKAAKLEMDYAYDMLKDLLDPEQKEMLKKVQVNWESYTQSECAFGTKLLAEPFSREMVYQDCLINIMQDRAETLNTYAQTGNISIEVGKAHQDE